MATLRVGPTSTVTLNNSVEYLPTNTYLALTSSQEEGRDGKNQSTCVCMFYFAKFKVNSRSIISEFFARMGIICKN